MAYFPGLLLHISGVTLAQSYAESGESVQVMITVVGHAVVSVNVVAATVQDELCTEEGIQVVQYPHVNGQYS